MEEIFVPALGMAMEQAILVEWLKEPGDEVVAGDDIALIETDKSTVELAATTSGRLGAHRYEAGANVPVGSTITEVLGADETPVDAPAAAGSTADAPPVDTPPVDASPPLGALAADDEAVVSTANTPDQTQPVEAGSSQTASADTAPPQTASTARAPHRLSPRQRRLAAVASLGGAHSDGGAESTTGTAAAASTAEPPPSAEDPARRAIARAVVRSWNEIPHFAVARDIDGDGLFDRLAVETEGRTGKISVTDVLVRALAVALSAHGPSDVGLAVATDHGVVLPVLPDAAQRSLAEISDLRRAAVARARSRRSTEDDARVPLVTLSNLGTHSVRWFTGIIPLGQRGLLTTGSLEQRPVVRAGRLGVGWEMSAVLNVDHRVWDGADGAALLQAFAQEIRTYAGGEA